MELHSLAVDEFVQLGIRIEYLISDFLILAVQNMPPLLAILGVEFLIQHWYPLFTQSTHEGRHRALLFQEGDQMVA